jgi:hypothetical protein
MIVKILDRNKRDVEARIAEGKKLKLPTIQEGWRFNFAKHSKAKGAMTYALVSLEDPNVIEGCLIYRMRNEVEPYMAYIEIAPHNRGKDKKYDLVAACLIAYACRLSFIHGKGDYKGWLVFDVGEEDQKQEEKLMKLYSSKYKARRFEKTTTMIIMPCDGEALIELYLNRR